MADWHGILTGAAASTLRRGRMAMAVVGAAIAGATPPTDLRARGARPPRLVWHVAGEGRGTPALDVSTAYFLSKHHEVIAVHRRTGAERWRRQTGEPGLTTAGSTLVVAGDVVIAGDYNVVAFDRADGGLRWRFSPIDGYGPGIYLGVTAGDLVLAGSPAGRIYAVEIASGRLRWSTLVSADETTVYAPVADAGTVAAVYMRFPTPGAGGIVVLDALTGQERWRAPFPAGTGPASRPAGGPLFANDCVVAASGDGAIHGFDRTDGARQWTIPPLGDTGIGGWDSTAQDFRALARVGPLLVAGSLTGIMSAYRTATRAERWRRASVDASTAFGIAADAELVYVPHLSGDLVAIGAADGLERWRLGRGPGFRWPPALDADRFYLSGSNSGFFAFVR